MPEIGGMKPRDAELEVLEKIDGINDFIQKNCGKVDLTESMDFGAGKELRFKKGTYLIEPIKFIGQKGVAPRIKFEFNGKEYDMKASKFMRIIGMQNERDELIERYEEYKKLSAKIQTDIDNLKPSKIEKVEIKTHSNFTKLFNSWKK